MAEHEPEAEYTAKGEAEWEPEGEGEGEGKPREDGGLTPEAEFALNVSMSVIGVVIVLVIIVVVVVVVMKKRRARCNAAKETSNHTKDTQPKDVEGQPGEKHRIDNHSPPPPYDERH